MSVSLKQRMYWVWQDKWLIAVLTWLPFLLCWLMWWIFSAGLVRSLPIGVVDLDHSQLSRQLGTHYQSSPTLNVAAHYPSVLEASKALKSGDIYAVAVIPSDFEKNTLLGFPPKVTAFYNSQYILIGKLVSSALLQAQGTFAAKVDTVKGLAAGNKVISQALNSAVPVRTQITALYNKNNNYAHFLVSAIVPAIWQVIVVAGTIMVLVNITRHQQLSGGRSWLSNQPVKTFIAHLLPFYVIFLLQGMVLISALYIGLSWPMQGSWLWLFFAQGLMVAACMIMGSLFFLLTFDGARALSLAGAYTAPGFAFMGVTFPVTDMTYPAQVWRSLLPSSHYIEIQVAQANYGLPAFDSLEPFMCLGLFVLPFIFVVLLIKKHVKQFSTEVCS
ncbi:ABC transporter permease [Vibrio sp. Of7-15]|uniref:ABC transporter permease n=1 Tax=Vibrio sp. Of7-15 TaxID=2724879 RepID=UPI001EF28B82|nr:ABC transporter permease [Vibrio sp. Of7-15]MCG7496641.1 ABC transporter permease [Vibrio sp. Of7-15]